LIHWFLGSLIVGSSSDSLIHRFLPASIRWIIGSLIHSVSCASQSPFCSFVYAPHNGFVASTSQNSFYRTSSPSYSGFIF
jgi:hypothetical protein